MLAEYIHLTGIFLKILCSVTDNPLPESEAVTGKEINQVKPKQGKASRPIEGAWEKSEINQEKQLEEQEPIPTTSKEFEQDSSSSTEEILAALRSQPKANFKNDLKRTYCLSLIQSIQQGRSGYSAIVARSGQTRRV